MGKQWIRKYALALSKEMLGQVRGKFATIPIPGNDVTLNASDLLTQAKEEQTSLKEELRNQLDKLTYSALVKSDAELAKKVRARKRKKKRGSWLLLPGITIRMVLLLKDPFIEWLTV